MLVDLEKKRHFESKLTESMFFLIDTWKTSSFFVFG